MTNSPSRPILESADLPPPGAARHVLAQLADAQVHSGQGLAARLGVTRAAIWKNVGQLRKQGLPIMAVAGQGYQLPWPVELLDIKQIRAALPASAGKLLAKRDILWRPSSTSDVLRQQTASISASPRFVLAESQSAGRGRRGRKWVSAPGLNICLSLGVRFDCGAVGLAGLSLAVGVMLVRALSDAGYTGAGLKWPNDLVVDKAKLAGVLVELEGEYSGPSIVIIGVGLNLRMPPLQRTVAGQPTTDLASLMSGRVPSRNALVASMIERLFEGMGQFQQHGFAAFADEYAQRDLLHGKSLKIVAPQTTWYGQGAGVDARGALRVQTKTGRVSVDSAEVSVRRA